MSSCMKCGAARERVGVICPARRLCPCEKRACATCGKAAVIVEFQSSVKADEPPLPKKSDDAIAVFYCAADAPYELPIIVVAPLVAPAMRKKQGKPHIHPTWAVTMPEGPPGAHDTQRVQCAGCRDVHAMRTRRLFNGTRSECPRCGHSVHTPAWEEERAS